MQILKHPIVAAAIAGALAAARVDYVAFKEWKSVDDFTRYDWKTAGFRWAQGAVSGALSAAGIGYLVG